MAACIGCSKNTPRISLPAVVIITFLGLLMISSYAIWSTAITLRLKNKLDALQQRVNSMEQQIVDSLRQQNLTNPTAGNFNLVAAQIENPNGRSKREAAAESREEDAFSGFLHYLLTSMKRYCQPNEKFCFMGPKGNMGFPGIPGLPGSPGESGTPGGKGDKGIRGEAGKRGPQGNKGLTGQKGNHGHTGRPGLPGVNGTKGTTGNRGEKGNKGDPGYRGQKGMKGNQGERGNPGNKGLKGEQGVKGEQGKTLCISEKKQLWFSPKYGGQGGGPFNDSTENSLSHHKFAKQLDMWYDNVQKHVAAVQMTLDTGALPHHGGIKRGSSNNPKVTLSLLKDDAFVHAQGTYSAKYRFVSYLKITTASGQSLSMGQPDGTRFSVTVPSQYQIVGFYGRSGSLVDAIGFIASYNNCIRPQKKPSKD